MLSKQAIPRLQYESLETRMLLTGNDCVPTITQNGSTVIVVASDADDIVELVMGETQHDLNVSGNQYSFDANQVSEIRIGGGFGNNQIRVVGSIADDSGTALGVNGTMTSSAYSVFTFGFASTTLDGGGGNNFAQLFGSNADDSLQGLPESSQLTTPDAILIASNFYRVDAFGRGGTDYAAVYGTQQNDHFGATEEFTLMRGPGITKYTKGFERVDAFGRGGYDRTQLRDSSGNDSIVVMPEFAYLNNGNRISYTKGFEEFTATSTNGGYDQAWMFGVGAVDNVEVSPNTVSLTRGGIANTSAIENYDRVEVRDTNNTIVDDQLADFAAMLGALQPFLPETELDDLAQRINAARNVINGTVASEELIGQAAAEEINTFTGNDVIYAQAGNDLVRGGNGNDSLDVGQGEDVGYGGGGHDELKGGDGDDILFGGAGNDIVDGEFGNDFVSGGAGSDIFRVVPVDELIVITDFTPNRDRIELINMVAGDITTGTQWGSLTINNALGLNIVLLGISPILDIEDLPIDFVTSATQTLFDPNQ